MQRLLTVRNVSWAALGRVTPVKLVYNPLSNAKEPGQPTPAQQPTPLYNAGSTRLLRISSGATAVNAVYWGVYITMLQNNVPETYSSEPWGYLGLGVSAFTCFVANTFANRWVGSITYVPRVDSLALSTHNFFGQEKIPRLVKIGQTEVAPLTETSLYYIVKVKGDAWFYLLDKDEGVFHDKDFLLALLAGDRNLPVRSKQVAIRKLRKKPTLHNRADTAHTTHGEGSRALL
ncbi:unnamed protein product [Discosporangium mesarthrocarpum]